MRCLLDFHNKNRVKKFNVNKQIVGMELRVISYTVLSQPKVTMKVNHY